MLVPGVTLYTNYAKPLDYEKDCFNYSCCVGIVRLHAGQTPDVTPEKSDSAVSTCQKVKSGLKKAYDKTRNEVEQVGDTIADGTVTAYDKAKCGTKKSAGKIVNGTEKAYDSTKNGVKKISKKVADGAVSSFDEVKEGTVKAAKK